MEVNREYSLTTGKVAELCQVTKRTVIKWIDSGKLRGYTLPDSRHRRVSLWELRRFAREHKLPHPIGAAARPRVLVVEDDPDFVELLRDSLSGDFDLAFAGSALEATSKFHLFNPEFILLDIRLPDVSGMEVCRHFREHCRARRIPILAMSAYGKSLNLDELKKRGASDFIAKPFKMEELMERIQTMSN